MFYEEDYIYRVHSADDLIALLHSIANSKEWDKRNSFTVQDQKGSVNNLYKIIQNREFTRRTAMATPPQITSNQFCLIIEADTEQFHEIMELITTNNNREVVNIGNTGDTITTNGAFQLYFSGLEIDGSCNENNIAAREFFNPKTIECINELINKVPTTIRHFGLTSHEHHELKDLFRAFTLSQNSKLESLRIANNGISSDDIELIARSLSNGVRVLKHLEFNDNSIEDADVLDTKAMRTLIQAFKNLQLMSLSINDCEFQSSFPITNLADVITLSSSEKTELVAQSYPALEFLNLSNINIINQDQLSDGLRRMFDKCPINTLILNNTRLEQNALQVISDVITRQNTAGHNPSKRLKNLSLESCFNYIDEANGPMINIALPILVEALRDNHVLERLRIGFNNGTASREFVPNIAQIVSNSSSLRALDISHSNLNVSRTGDFTTLIKAIYNNPSLKIVSFEDNYLSDAAFEIIARQLLARGCNLEELNLSNCRISNQGAGFILEAIRESNQEAEGNDYVQISNLRSLDLEYEDIDQEIVTDIEQELRRSQKIKKERLSRSVILSSLTKEEKKVNLEELEGLDDLFDTSPPNSPVSRKRAREEDENSTEENLEPQTKKRNTQTEPSTSQESPSPKPESPRSPSHRPPSPQSPSR